MVHEMPHTRIHSNAHRHDSCAYTSSSPRDKRSIGQKRQSFEFISRTEIQDKFSFIINLDLPVKPEDDKEKE